MPQTTDSDTPQRPTVQGTNDTGPSKIDPNNPRSVKPETNQEGSGAGPDTKMPVTRGG